MSAKHTRGYMLVQMMVVVILISVVVGMGSYALDQTLKINRRVTAWANDDVATRDMLQWVRRDVAAAVGVETVAQQRPILRVRRPEGMIRYQADNQTVERLTQSDNGPPGRRTWRFRRSSFGWTVERSAGGGALVWTDVTVRDPKDPSRPPTLRYAVAVRAGLAGPVGDSP